MLHLMLFFDKCVFHECNFEKCNHGRSNCPGESVVAFPCFCGTVSYNMGTSSEVFPPICRVSVVVTGLLSSINAIPLCPDVFFLFEDPPLR